MLTNINYKFKEGAIFCNYCGAEIVEDDRFCRPCGKEIIQQKRVKNAEETEENESKFNGVSECQYCGSNRVRIVNRIHGDLEKDYIVCDECHRVYLLRKKPYRVTAEKVNGGTREYLSIKKSNSTATIF